MLKNTYPYQHTNKTIYRWDPETLRIGTEDTDIWEIYDPEKHWESLIGLCDGVRSIEEISEEMVKRFNVQKEIVLKALDKFVESNCIIFKSEPYKENELFKRFGPNLRYFAGEGFDGEATIQKFKNMKVAVLGAGGGGSQFIMQLVGLGVGHIKIADYDRVEISNLSRQLPYEFKDIGEYKVEAAKRYIENRDSDIKVEIFNQQLIEVETIESIIEGVDWVFCAMDEPAYIGQRRVNQACVKLGIPCVFAFSQRQNARMFEIIPGTTGCADCCLKHTAETSPSFLQFVKSMKNSKVNPGTALIPPTMSLLSSWVMKRWVDIVIGKETRIGNRILRFDFDTYEIKEVTKWTKDEACPTCGSNPVDSKQSKELWRIIPIDTEKEVLINC